MIVEFTNSGGGKFAVNVDHIVMVRAGAAGHVYIDFSTGNSMVVRESYKEALAIWESAHVDFRL